MILYFLVLVNGLTYILISFLLAFFTYINEGTFPYRAPVEIMIYMALIVVLTAVSFKQLGFWTRSLFVPVMHTHRLCKTILSIILKATFKTS